MLIITVPESELFNEETQEFILLPKVVLELEHSLISLSKWESKFEKPFLTSEKKTSRELYSYIECMILTPNFPPGVIGRFTPEILDEVNDYIESKQSATTFGDLPERKTRGEIITSELIYYWMVAFKIPFECEIWHLNRLFSLIRICNIKNTPPKKLSRAEIAQRNRALNEQRRQKYGTRG